jgi:hypothetical protein
MHVLFNKFKNANSEPRTEQYTLKERVISVTHTSPQAVYGLKPASFIG